VRVVCVAIGFTLAPFGPDVFAKEEGAKETEKKPPTLTPPVSNGLPPLIGPPFLYPIAPQGPTPTTPGSGGAKQCDPKKTDHVSCGRQVLQ